MNRALIAEDAGAELYKRGFDVRTNGPQVEVSLPGLLVIVSAESPHCTRAWMWHKYGEAEDEIEVTMERTNCLLP